MKKQQPLSLEGYSNGYILAPTRPDIDRLIVVPYKMIYLNLSAHPSANVTRVIFNLDESVGFVVYRLERF